MGTYPPVWGWGRRGKVAAPSPKPAMWQLKEPSKPKCVCAHTQFITAEHMANILTHVSRSRKTNRARAARGSGPHRRGCAAAAGPGAGRVGPPSREPGAGRGSARRPAAPRRATARAPATLQLGIKSGRGPARSPSPGPSGAAALQVSLLLVRGADVLGGARNAAGGARNAAESSSRSGAGVALRCQARASAAARDPNALQAPCCARLWVLRTPSGASLPLAAPDLAGSPSRGVRKQQVGKCWASEVPLRLRWFLGGGGTRGGAGPARLGRGREKFYLTRRPGAPFAARFPAGPRKRDYPGGLGRCVAGWRDGGGPRCCTQPRPGGPAVGEGRLEGGWSG